MYNIPLPTTVGGSLIANPKKGGRVSGPPSKMFPVLRDLAEAAEAQVTIEIDTEKDRYVGVLTRMSNRRSATPHLVITGTGKGVNSLSLDKILAFRVLKIEVDELPAIL